MPRRTKHAVRKWYGEIFRIPPREGGALGHCAFCSKSVWIPDRARKSWNAVDRAAAAIQTHVRLAHPDKILKVWDPKVVAEVTQTIAEIALTGDVSERGKNESLA